MTPRVHLCPRTALRNAMRRSIEQAHYHPERAEYYIGLALRAAWGLFTMSGAK